MFRSLIIILVYCNLASGLDLSDYQAASFTNPQPSSAFNHFVSYNQNLYVGSVDALYRLGEDFSRQQTVDTAGECEEGVAECPNYNKILLVYEENNTLVTCGSLYGLCQARNLADITEVLLEGEQLVLSSGTLTTEAIIAPGAFSDDVLYVANTYDEIRYNMHDVYPVSRRNVIPMLDEMDEHFIFFQLDGPDSGIQMASTVTKIQVDFIIHYISSFTLDGFSYFVQSQVQDFEGTGTKEIYLSKISRVCHGDKNFDSYSEILLRCQGQDSSDDYNLVQAAHVGSVGTDLAVSLGLNVTDDVLYGVFAKSQTQEGDVPSNQSALCIFKLSDIEDAFISAIAGCLRSGEYGLKYLSGSNCDQRLSVSIISPLLNFVKYIIKLVCVKLMLILF